MAFANQHRGFGIDILRIEVASDDAKGLPSAPTKLDDLHPFNKRSKSTVIDTHCLDASRRLIAKIAINRQIADLRTQVTARAGRREINHHSTLPLTQSARFEANDRLPHSTATNAAALPK